MILTLIIGFFLGLSIPVTASRFGKVLPADPGMVIATLWHKPRFPKTNNPERQKQLMNKWKKMAYFSFGWSIVMAALFGASYLLFPTDMFYFACAFFYIVGMLMAVDHQYYLLPDFFTIPLMLLGLTSAFYVETPNLSFEAKLVGAWFGYALSTISVLLMYFFKKCEFGAGDVKMLTAFGAWFGAFALNIAVVLSFVFFAITVMIKKKRADAFGPALGLAGIIVFFLVYLNLLFTFM